MLPLSRLDALHASRDTLAWQRWALRALLLLAGLHLAAGVIFFFAYNWDALPAMAKFAILEAGILFACLPLFVNGGRRWLYEGGLVAASLLTGVLFAVIYQVYQTGADAWELFLTWSLLILPWSLASRSTIQWGLWSLVSLTAIGTFIAQRLVMTGLVDDNEATALMATSILVYLAGFEVAHARPASWLHIDVLRRAFLSVGGLVLFTGAFPMLIDWDQAQLNFLLFVVSNALLLYVYRRPISDFAAVTVVLVFVSVMLMCFGGRIVLELSEGASGDLAWTFKLLLIGLWSAFVTRVAIGLLRQWRHEVEP